jgi:hypothetical protein
MGQNAFAVSPGMRPDQGEVTDVDGGDADAHGSPFSSFQYVFLKDGLYGYGSTCPMPPVDW